MHKSHTVHASKGKGRKQVPHRLSIQKADNGGYTVDQQHRFADDKANGMGEYPDSKTHVFGSFGAMHEAIPRLMGESLAEGDKAASNEDGEEELPED